MKEGKTNQIVMRIIPAIGVALFQALTQGHGKQQSIQAAVLMEPAIQMT